MQDYRDIHNSKQNNEVFTRRILASSMSDKQKENIRRFVIDLRIGKAGSKVKDRRLNNYLQFMIKLHCYFMKDLDNISEKEATDCYMDLQDNRIAKVNGMPYAQASKDEFVKTLKRYLGWLWGRSSIRYRKTISWMKEDYKKSDKKAITLKEAEQIIKREPYLRNKCLFLFLFDSGARIEEALNVRIKDLLNANNSEVGFLKVHLRGQKTEEADRTIPIPISQKITFQWLKEHPTGYKDDYLFPIRYDNARKIIKQMSYRILGFNIKPHELRHSSATHYIQYGGFGAENIGGFYYRYGWKFGSKEALTYIKTYLYSGDIGAQKVVKAIESSKVERLEQEIAELKDKINSLMNGKHFMAVLSSLAKKNQSMFNNLDEVSGKKFDFVL